MTQTTDSVTFTLTPLDAAALLKFLRWAAEPGSPGFHPIVVELLANVERSATPSPPAHVMPDDACPTCGGSGHYGDAARRAINGDIPAPQPNVRVKPLQWDGNEARSPVGQYRVQRLDDKWEPLHDGYYLLPRLHGIVKAFDTFDQAKEHAVEDYRKRALSIIEAPPPEAREVVR